MIALVVMAVAGFALAGQRASRPPRETARHANGGRLHEGDDHGGASGRSDGVGPSDTGVDTATDATAECATAVSTGEGAVESKTGLAHAIDVLLANCGRGQQALGLVDALQQLQEAQARHDDAGHGNGGVSSSAGEGNPSGHQPSGGDGGRGVPPSDPGQREAHRNGGVAPNGGANSRGSG